MTITQPILRWDDLSNLTVDSLRFEESHLAVLLKKRKNDQFREGSWVMIARSESKPCPAAVVERFIGRGGHKERSKLFRRILHTKNGFKLREESMTYSRANQLLKTELKNEGLNEKSYGIHIFREGGE